MVYRPAETSAPASGTASTRDDIARLLPRHICPGTPGTGTFFAVGWWNRHRWRMSAPTTRVFLLPAALYLTRLPQKSDSEQQQESGQPPIDRPPPPPNIDADVHDENLADSRPVRKASMLETLLLQAWGEYNLELATARPADAPFVQLAAALSDASVDGRCRMLLQMPPGWSPFIPWVEQLMEESLGKGGRGIVVFENQALNPKAPGY